MHCRAIGPSRAGRARAVAGVPSQPNVAYIGFDNGGVWRTEVRSVRARQSDFAQRWIHWTVRIAKRSGDPDVNCRLADHDGDDDEGGCSSASDSVDAVKQSKNRRANERGQCVLPVEMMQLRV